MTVHNRATEGTHAVHIPFDPRDHFKQFNVSNSVGYNLIKKNAPFDEINVGKAAHRKLLQCKCVRQIGFHKMVFGAKRKTPHMKAVSQRSRGERH